MNFKKLALQFSALFVFSITHASPQPLNPELRAMLQKTSEEAKKRGADKTVLALEKLLKADSISEEDLYKVLNTITNDEKVTDQYPGKKAGLIKDLGKSPEILKNIIKHD